MNRFERPAWTTATTLPAAFVRRTSPSERRVAYSYKQVAGIIAGVLIYLGARKTRRTKQVEGQLRLALEMEGDIDKAKRIDSSGTPSAVAVAVEAPLAPTDVLAVEMPPKITSASISENHSAPAPIDYTNGGCSVHT